MWTHAFILKVDPLVLIKSILFLFLKLFIYLWFILAALGLSWGMWDPVPLRWELGVLPTGPPGKSTSDQLFTLFSNFLSALSVFFFFLSLSLFLLYSHLVLISSFSQCLFYFPFSFFHFTCSLFSLSFSSVLLSPYLSAFISFSSYLSFYLPFSLLPPLLPSIFLSPLSSSSQSIFSYSFNSLPCLSLVYW